MNAWENNIRKVVPYTPGEQPKQSNIIKLNTNENPYPPTPGVLKLMTEMDGSTLRKYPDPEASMLIEMLAREYGVDSDEIFVGVGSDDVIGMSFLTFFNGDKPILFPNITYSFYDVWAKLFKIPYETPVLDEKFEINPEDYIVENGGVIIANPNAPTGVELSLEKIEYIIKNNQNSVVIVDEAYVDFGGTSALPLIKKYKNLLVVQTFSKSRSMAGMRIGYAFGDKRLIKYLRDVKYSYNSYTMNMPSILLGTESLKDKDYFTTTVNKIISTREKTKIELKKLGFEFEDSKTNFIFATWPGTDANKLFEDLKYAGIYVRYFKIPIISNYLRISIGTDEEMDILIKFLKAYRG